MFLGITWGELGILADGELLLAETADSEKGSIVIGDYDEYGDCNHNNDYDDGHLKGDSPFCSGWSRQDIAPF